MSGDVSHLTDAVISGVDEFVSEFRRDPGDTRFSLTAFDTRVEHVQSPSRSRRFRLSRRRSTSRVE